MDNIGTVMNAMINYYAGDAKRINHFLKVFGFAKAVGQGEALDANTQEIVEIAALMHDIGIKNSELKFNSSDGKNQEKEGPPEAKTLLEQLGLDSDIIDRVCWLIARHHTYSNIQEIDYQILVEADFLVNAFEDNLPFAAIQSFKNNVFKTKSGIALLKTIYSC